MILLLIIIINIHYKGKGIRTPGDFLGKRDLMRGREARIV